MVNFEIKNRSKMVNIYKFTVAMPELSGQYRIEERGK